LPPSSRKPAWTASGGNNPGPLDTYAAPCPISGKTGEAVEWQKKPWRPADAAEKKELEATTLKKYQDKLAAK